MSLVVRSLYAQALRWPASAEFRASRYQRPQLERAPRSLRWGRSYSRARRARGTALVRARDLPSGGSLRVARGQHRAMLVIDAALERVRNEVRRNVEELEMRCAVIERRFRRLQQV